MTGRQTLGAVGFAMWCGFAAQMVARDYGVADAAYLGMPVAFIALALVAVIEKLGGE